MSFSTRDVIVQSAELIQICGLSEHLSFFFNLCLQDALDPDDVDNLPYPTAFDEEENSSSHPAVIKPSDYHIDDEETIVKSDENKGKRIEEKSEDATEKSNEVENEEIIQRRK